MYRQPARRAMPLDSLVQYNYIAIEGNIGSGKTSLCTRIAAEYNAKLVLEQFEDNPFLPKFYEDQERYAFQVELSFLADRYRQINENVLTGDLFSTFTISDYILAKSLIFSRITLQEDELTLYSNLFNIMHTPLPKPDLLVYLYLDVDRLKQNIEQRGRSYESNVSSEYLESIHQGYFAYFHQSLDTRIVIIDCNNIDFVKNEDDHNRIMEVLGTRYDHGINRVLL